MPTIKPSTVHNGTTPMTSTVPTVPPMPGGVDIVLVIGP
jgi:hypothetical protein